MAIDDVYLLSLRGTLNGRPTVNTLAFRRLVAAEPITSEFVALATTIKDGFKFDQVDDLTYQDWRALKVRGAGVTYQTEAPFRISTVAYAGPFTGTLTGSNLQPPQANNCATVIAIATEQAGRRRKGRIFLPGLPENAVGDNSIIAATHIANVVLHAIGALAAYYPPGTDTTWRLGVWSDRIAMNVKLSNTWPRERISAGPPDPGTAFADAASLDVRSYVGSQRNRRPGI